MLIRILGSIFLGALLFANFTIIFLQYMSGDYNNLLNLNLLQNKGWISSAFLSLGVFGLFALVAINNFFARIMLTLSKHGFPKTIEGYNKIRWRGSNSLSPTARKDLVTALHVGSWVFTWAFSIAGLLVFIGSNAIYSYYGSLSTINSKWITILVAAVGSFIYGRLFSVAFIMLGNALFTSTDMRNLFLDRNH